jgi:hypothetical protein
MIVQTLLSTKLKSTAVTDRRAPPVAGAQDIGRGSFCHVYSHELDPSVVIKVMVTDDNKAMIDYFRYCKYNHKNNPYLLKVYSILKSGIHTLVITEKLVNHYGLADEFIFDNMILSEEWETAKPKSFANKKIKSILSRLSRIAKKHEYTRFDMHGNNIMFRNGNADELIPVINDPLYDRKAFLKLHKMKQNTFKVQKAPSPHKVDKEFLEIPLVHQGNKMIARDFKPKQLNKPINHDESFQYAYMQMFPEPLKFGTKNGTEIKISVSKPRGGSWPEMIFDISKLKINNLNAL